MVLVLATMMLLPELHSLCHYGPVPRVGHTVGAGGLGCGSSYVSMAFWLSDCIRRRQGGGEGLLHRVKRIYYFGESEGQNKNGEGETT